MNECECGHKDFYHKVIRMNWIVIPLRSYCTNTNCNCKEFRKEDKK